MCVFQFIHSSEYVEYFKASKKQNVVVSFVLNWGKSRGSTTHFLSSWGDFLILAAQLSP